MVRDYVARHALTNVTEYTETLVIGGSTIRIDSDSAKTILRCLRVNQNALGEYIAELRDAPLESVGTAGTRPDSPFPFRAVPDRTTERLVCDICGEKDADRALAVDHDHATGALRGYLCRRCNSALGFFRDQPELMRRGADYIENPPGIPVLRYV